MDPENQDCNSGSDDYHSMRQTPFRRFVICLLSKSKASVEREISQQTDASLSEFWEVAKVLVAKVGIYQWVDENRSRLFTR
jgi:hypothetical protein